MALELLSRGGNAAGVGAGRTLAPADPRTKRRRQLCRDLRYIGVVEDAGGERELRAAALLRDLGADVRTIGVRDDPIHLIEHDDDDLGVRPRAIIVELLDRPDFAPGLLRALRKVPAFERVGTMLAIASRHVTRVDPARFFDDFVVHPYRADELYTRVRALEHRRTEPATEPLQIGPLLVDRTERRVRLGDRSILLTKKELLLLAYLGARPAQAVSRQQLLANVWGSAYRGSPRTVDIHVRRLRQKLGDALPLSTLRGFGYRLEIA
jgi:hypothetical protein